MHAVDPSNSIQYLSEVQEGAGPENSVMVKVTVLHFRPNTKSLNAFNSSVFVALR